MAKKKALIVGGLGMMVLGLFNILPLPALDGGRLMFMFYEVIFRRRGKPRDAPESGDIRNLYFFQVGKSVWLKVSNAQTGNRRSTQACP